MASVLIIDDNEGCRVYLRQLLSRAGYDVFELPDGRNVVAFLAANPIDAVITDLFMPGADGLETLRNVKQHAPAVPVIGITGAASSEDDCYIQAMMLLGASAVLLKPFEGEALLLAVDQVLAGNAEAP